MSSVIAVKSAAGHAVVAGKPGPGRAVIAAGLRGSKGEAGAQGEQGLPFQVDAQGLLANRGAFDDEAAGFSYLATDTGELYFRQGAAGVWSDGVAFQGPPGDSAYAVAVANGFVGTEVEWLASLDGADGADGRGITAAEIDGSGHLLLTYSDLTQEDLGLVVGAPGAPGDPGIDGVDGRGITSMAIDGSSHLIITYTDTTTEDAGLIPGAGGSAAWGSIGGTLADQTDLQAALNGKATSAQGALADTAVQPAALTTALADKVDKDGSKVLSDENYSSAEKSKLTGVAASATANPDTDSLAESATPTNKWFTEARVRAALATGLSFADSTVIAATDSFLQALGKLAARLTLAFDRANHTGSQSISTVTGLQTALDGKAAPPATRTISGTSGTLVPSDAGNIVLCTSASAVNLSIQLEASGAWPAASVVTVIQLGAGIVTITDGSGITVNVFSGMTKALRGQYAQAALARTAANTFAMAGMLGGTPA